MGSHDERSKIRLTEKFQVTIFCFICMEYGVFNQRMNEVGCSQAGINHPSKVTSDVLM